MADTTKTGKKCGREIKLATASGGHSMPQSLYYQHQYSNERRCTQSVRRRARDAQCIALVRVGREIRPTCIARGRARGTWIALIVSCDEATSVASGASVITRWHKTLPHGDDLYVLFLIPASGHRVSGAGEQIAGGKDGLRIKGLRRCVNACERACIRVRYLCRPVQPQFVSRPASTL
jgi:hypothetical protein